MLEALDRRDVPASFYWRGGGSAGDPASWWENAVPQAGDDVVFWYGSYSGNSPDFGGPSGGGYYHSVTLVAQYGGTVTLASGFATEHLNVQGGTIDQPTAGTDIIVGPASSDSSGTFDWTGGTINSTSNLAAVYVQGAVTFTIDPGGGTLRTGSTFTFEGTDEEATAAGTVRAGTVEIGNGAGINLDQYATMTVEANDGKGGKAYFEFKAIEGTYAKDNRSLTLGKGSELIVYGPGTFTNEKIALILNGGTAEFKNNVPATIITPDATRIPYPVTVQAGTLKLHTGSTITAGGKGVTINGGTLALIGDNSGPAKIDGKFALLAGTISFSGNYLIFDVTGEVSWLSGTFRPRIDIKTSKFSDTWQIDGGLSIIPPEAGKPITTIIAPVTQNYILGQVVNTNYEWVVIRITGAVNGTPGLTSDGPNYQRYNAAPASGVTDWVLKVP